MISLTNEVNIMSKINHPAIIKFIGFSPIDFKNHEKPVIFTEYAVNKSLSDIINLERQSTSKKSWDDTKKLINIYGIASGMTYLHAHDIIQRDLKPGNILMDENLNPKISDFGLSKINHSKSSTLQSMPGIKGTPIYIAPEIWDTQQYGKAGDVYSFSLIMYEIITNEIPYENILSISQIYTKMKKVLHLVTVEPNTSEKVVEVDETEKNASGGEVNINDIVKYSEGDANKEFIVGKNYIEGINGFPKDTSLGVNYLKKANKGGCIESIIYYCNLLIEGKIIPKNVLKAKKYLSKSL